MKNRWIIAAGTAVLFIVAFTGIYALMESGDTEDNEKLEHETPVDVTIPEGLSLEEMGEIFAEENLMTEEEWMEALDEDEVREHEVTEWVPDNDDEEREHEMEGLLFPATYTVSPEEEPSDVALTMLDQMQEEVNESIIDQAEESDQLEGVYDALVLASLIERETMVAEERPQVSGVYHNRLEEDMLLQADATVQYLFDEQQEQVTYDDLEIESPYNTYQEEGMPPGPISSVSRESIEAAVDPEAHDYLFYVTKKDGSHEHYFAETYEEHEENIEQSEENAAEQKE